MALNAAVYCLIAGTQHDVANMNQQLIIMRGYQECFHAELMKKHYDLSSHLGVVIAEQMLFEVSSKDLGTLSRSWGDRTPGMRSLSDYIMNTAGFNYIVIMVLFATTETNGNVSSPVPIFSPTVTSVPMLVMKTTSSFSQIEQNVNVDPSFTVPSLAQPTHETADISVSSHQSLPSSNTGLSPELPSSNLSPVPQSTETSQLPQIPQSANSEVSNVSRETNSINEFFTEDETFVNINKRTASPQVENSVQDVPSAKPTLVVSDEPAVTLYDGTETDVALHETEASNTFGGSTTNHGKLGFEPWKIGLISAAVFLAVEAIVLIVYCFVCGKRRRVNIAKHCEQDSEAGETINVESNDNTVTGEEGTFNGVPLQPVVDSLHTAVQKEKEQRKSELQDIIMDNRSTDV
ncbi:uncharacterized protein RCH25_036271 [Pelodytes ibericus]